MSDGKPDLALSRTFKFVDGVLSAADQSEQWAEALSRHGGARQAALTAGETVDSKYRILSLVGAGGMGSVYRVQHLQLGKEMALKTFSAATLTPDAWQRFQREAQAIAKLTHVNIVQVFDFGIGQNKVPYYTMELLSGQSLADKIESQGRLPLEQALPIFIATAEALCHAHNLGIVHRDIKPANIFLNRGTADKPVVKVVDFGIAKLATSQSVDDQSKTDIGLVFGSPLYMSPEQSMGEATDHRTDIYSYGCLMFEVLTGHPPFLGKNAFETISMHHFKTPPHLVDAAGGVQFSPSAEALIIKLLAKDVTKRYQSFEEVLADLARVRVIEQGPGNQKTAPQAAPGQNRLLPAGSQVGAQGDSQALSQGFTGPFANRHVGLAILGGAALLLALVALGVSFFAFSGNNHMQSLPKSDIAVTPSGLKAAGDFYSSPAPDGGKIFQFPEDMLIGTLSWPGCAKQRARGRVTVPPHVAVNFAAGDALRNDPLIFSHFRPDDIDSLNCNSDKDLTWGTRHVDCITYYLSGLGELDLSGARIDGSSIAHINRLKNLRVLLVSDSKLTASDLMRLNCLTKLVSFEASLIKQMSPVLEKLRTNTAIWNLGVEGCGLTDTDAQAIAGIVSLQHLTIGQNDISCDGLRALAKLPKLGGLSIAGTKIGPECTSIFRSFKNLTVLRINNEGWTEADMDRVRKLLPPRSSVSFFDDDKKVSKFLYGDK